MGKPVADLPPMVPRWVVATALGAGPRWQVKGALGQAAQMPTRAVAGAVDEHDTRLWRVLHHYVDRAGEALSMKR